MTSDPRLDDLLAELTPRLALLGPLDDDLLSGLNDPRLSKPETAKGRLQRAFLIRTRVHERDPEELPTNNRFLFYELEQCGVVSKEQRQPRKPGETPRRPDQDTTDASAHLRKVGLVSWAYIEDETRELTDWETAPTVAEYVARQVDYARIDPWDGRPAPLTICESRSLAGTMRAVAARYCCPITSTNGQSLGHVVRAIVPVLLNGDRDVLYLGDYDLSGNQIEQATRNTLREYGATWRSWTRVALRADQVAELERERAERGVEGDLVIRKTDKRYRGGGKVFDAVKCETVGQGPLRRLLTAALDDLLAPVVIEVSPIARPANPFGARSSVAPRMTNRNTAVSTISATITAHSA